MSNLESPNRSSFEDSFPGDGLEKFFYPRDIQNCEEFLRIMEAKEFPLAHDIYGDSESVEGYIPRGVLSHILGLKVRSETKTDRELIARGYPIGIAIQNPTGTTFKEFQTSYYAPTEDLRIPSEYLTLAEKYGPFLFDADPRGKDCIYLCVDARIRNDKGGTIPPEYTVIIGGKIYAEWGHDASRGVSYLAELPLEDVLEVQKEQAGAV